MILIVDQHPAFMIGVSAVISQHNASSIEMFTKCDEAVPFIRTGVEAIFLSTMMIGSPGWGNLREVISVEPILLMLSDDARASHLTGLNVRGSMWRSTDRKTAEDVIGKFFAGLGWH